MKAWKSYVLGILYLKVNEAIKDLNVLDQVVDSDGDHVRTDTILNKVKDLSLVWHKLHFC